MYKAGNLTSNMMLMLVAFAGLTDHAARAETALPAVVVLGGFNSCNALSDDPFDRPMFNAYAARRDLVANRNGGQAPEHLFTCFNLAGSVLYTSSANPGEIGSASEISEVLALVGQFAGDRPTVLVGHSHGGWLAMVAAHRLGDDIRVHNLTTLDPISLRDCNIDPISPPDVGDLIAMAPFCTSAPKDLDDVTDEIAAKVSSWHNFYQDQVLYLRSSAIAAATTNSRLEFSGTLSLLDFRLHQYVDRSERVWSVIEREIDAAM